jgi:dihydropteroate synthase
LEQLHQLVTYSEGIVEGVRSWLEQRIELLLKEGIRPEQIWIDPGIGFGKSVEDQWRLLGGLHRLKSLGFPLYVGLSRKSFLGKQLQLAPEQLLPASLAVAHVAAEQGVDYLRVHEIEPYRKALFVNH